MKVYILGGPENDMFIETIGLPWVIYSNTCAKYIRRKVKIYPLCFYVYAHEYFDMKQGLPKETLDRIIVKYANEFLKTI